MKSQKDKIEGDKDNVKKCLSFIFLEVSVELRNSNEKGFSLTKTSFFCVTGLLNFHLTLGTTTNVERRNVWNVKCSRSM